MPVADEVFRRSPSSGAQAAAPGLRGATVSPMFRASEIPSLKSPRGL